MLTALHLGNFKAFGSPAARMPIRPITLIFGPNSGGKSSLIHGLVLGHEALFKKRFDIKRTKLGGNSIDLGGFRQYLHRRNTDRVITWGAEFSVPDNEKHVWDADRWQLMSTIGLEPSVKKRKDAKPRLLSYDARVNNEPLLKMSLLGNGRMQLQDLTPEFLRVGASLLAALINSPAEAQSINDDELRQGMHFPSDTIAPTFDVREALVNVENPSDLKDASPQQIMFFQLLAAVPTLLRATLQKYLGRLNYLGPLRSLPPRHLAFTEPDEITDLASGRKAWDRMRQSKDLRDAVNKWLDSEDRLHTRYRLERRQYIAPRTAKADILAALKEIESDAFITEQNLESDDPDEREAVVEVQWDPDEYVQIITEELLRNRRGDGDADLVLIDQTTKTAVSHRDVGIGISQVLPVLVEAYGNKERIVAIEQPEIHLHPRLQGELADVFLESALGPNKNTFILETHSEHMILRIMRRIRESTEGKLLLGDIKVRPEDVAVLYVEPDKNGSRIIEIPLTEDGELGARWPGGFFDDRLKELI